uniref:G-2 and S-phase expressed 1 n=1 Tax=Scleropages formosus TaxID=113540 RepID=A0A8C9SI62_SCLFO
GKRILHAKFVARLGDVFHLHISYSGKEDDEDEVFLGPFSHKEKCMSVGIDCSVRKDASSGRSVGEEPSWSPLPGDKFVEIFNEAHLLAREIERKNSDKGVAEEVRAMEKHAETKENFVDDPRAKLNVLGKAANLALSPIKRETFCVQNSPMKRLPPAIQRRLLKTGGAPSPTKNSASTSSPARVCKALPKNTLRSKAALSSTKVLPSRPIAPGTAPLLPPDKARLPRTEKGKMLRQRSPHTRHLSSAGSSEDLLSDGTSVTSDISDTSLNTSLPLKTGSSLPASRKVNWHFVKFNLPPSSTGKMNTSLNSSSNNVKARTSGSANKRLSSVVPTNTRTSSSLARAPELGPPVRSKTDLQAQPIKTTPVRKPQPTASQQTSKQNLERASSVPNVPVTVVGAVPSIKGSAKPKSFVVPTPRSQSTGLQQSECKDFFFLVLKLTFLAFSVIKFHFSCTGVLPPDVLQSPSIVGSPVQSKARRVSALPTPVKRRVSGIPLLTPKSVTRPSKSSYSAEMESLPMSLEPVSTEELSDPSELQPFSMEGEVREKTGILLNSTSEGCTPPSPVTCPSEHLESTKHAPQNQEPASPVGWQQLSDSNEVSKTQENEVLLVDAPPPVLRSEERLLIDLSNTPDFIKTSPVKPSGEQLIDLSSPLITWSPVDKENTIDGTPLINLSF